MKRIASSSRLKRRITYEELKQHSKYSDAWLSINGVVYDITRFINKHPFGDTFRGHLGSECSGLFSSAHTNTKVEELIKSDSFLKKMKFKLWVTLMYLKTTYTVTIIVPIWIALSTEIQKTMSFGKT